LHNCARTVSQGEHENYLVTRDHGLRLTGGRIPPFVARMAPWIRDRHRDNFTELRQAARPSRRAHDELEMRVEERTADLQRARQN